MKRRDAGRVLTFAVTGALLGGVGIGGCKYRGPYVNPGPDVTTPPPDGTEPVDGTEPTAPEPTEHVNEGPVDEPPAEEPLDPGTNNVRKVEEEPTPKHVNTVKVPDGAP